LLQLGSFIFSGVLLDNTVWFGLMQYAKLLYVKEKGQCTQIALSDLMIERGYETAS